VSPELRSRREPARKKLLIANRGEIAPRVLRTCRELGVAVVAVYSSEDRDSEVVRLADDAVAIGPAPARASYLNLAAIVQAALQTGADAVHPGYGFLAEDPDLAAVCAEEGITFVGPPADVIANLGDKTAARVMMREAGLPMLPGSFSPLRDSAEAAAAAARAGYPVIIKAAAGGGGRGMTVVTDLVDFRRRTPRRPRRPGCCSATIASTSSTTSNARGTSRSRSSATGTATPSIWASGTAPCSGVGRS
jgi:acetyl-CoA carboxylase biotin carboxylase subunit